MRKPSVMVVGSINTDLVVGTPTIPQPGETVLGDRFAVHQGGKGANQAVAAARMGADVKMVGCVGDDPFGSASLSALSDEGMDTSLIAIHPSEKSGVAFIAVADDGENAIVVAPGANSHVSPEQITPEVLMGVGLVLVQLEVPIPTVIHAIEASHEVGITTILNPAPACQLPKTLWRSVDILTPNAHEAIALVGGDVDDPVKAGEVLLEWGVGTVLVTLGKDGAVVIERGKEPAQIEPFGVDAVDTTAAGDAFNGALAWAIAVGKTVKEAARWGCVAGALAATGHGAQPSIPMAKKVSRLIDSV